MKKRLTLFLWLFGLVYTFPVYNKYWAPFDEGIIAVAAQRLLAGEVPYKDFFIIMYPPGQIYALAAFFKLFSGSIIAGRIYAVFVSVAIAVVSYLITRALTKRTAVSVAAYIVMLAALAPRLGAIPAPIWPGILLALTTIYLFIRYLENPRISRILSVGIFAGLTALFRHDIGFSVFFAILIPLVISIFKARSFKDAALFIIGAAAVTLPWILYFLKMSAGKDLFDSLIAFAFIHAKTATIALPKPCFDLNMIFHQSLYFISANQFYIPLIAYVQTSLLVLVRLFSRQIFKREVPALVALLVFGLLIYKEAAVRADPAHLLAMIAPCVILSAYLAGDAFYSRSKFKIIKFYKCAVSGLLIFLLVLLTIKNTDKYIKNCYTKPFKKDTIKTRFKAGSIYLPREEREDVRRTVEYIENNTSAGERIYIGNIAHRKDDFGGDIMIYYLTDRLPSTKYYELLPGVVTNKEVQEEIASTLISKNVKYLILQGNDLFREDYDSDSDNALFLDKFIRQNYEKCEKFGKYNIFRKI